MAAKKVALLGATDRNNYGDLLFPVIAKAMLDQTNTIKNFATKRSDLSACGALPTLPFKQIKNFAPSAVIVVGGEVLSGTWLGTYLNLLEHPVSIFLFRLTNKIGFHWAIEHYVRRRFSNEQTLPWLLPISTKTSLYSAVGGVDLEQLTVVQKEAIKKSLAAATYITVRDAQSQRNLKKMGIQATVVPDTAYVVSVLYPLSHLESGLLNFTNTLPDHYFVFQIGNNYAINNVLAIAEALAETAKKLDLAIVLVPIGISAAHNDTLALKKIYKKLLALNVSDVVMLQDLTIFEIMLVIAKSQIFVGTSLHGCITSLSYSKPCVAIGGIKKLESVLMRGVREGVYCCPSFVNFVEYAEKAAASDQQKIKREVESLQLNDKNHFNSLQRFIDDSQE